MAPTDTETTEPGSIAAVSDPAATPEPSLFAGIEQQGAALGAPKAPVTLVEYADLQCPFCAQWARDALPTLVEDYVRTGKLRIVFSGMAFIGPDSEKALRSALAGRENHLWDVVHGLYLRQGHENAAGSDADQLVTEIAAGVPDLDGKDVLDTRWESDGHGKRAAGRHGGAGAGVNSTPAFQVGPSGGTLKPFGSARWGRRDRPAIEAVLAR